jgi:hypothetical protein
MATAEFYRSFNEIRVFKNDARLEFEPPMKSIKRSYFTENEGQVRNLSVCCAKCGCALAQMRDRKILRNWLIILLKKYFYNNKISAIWANSAIWGQK